ncbi:hypothetical protein M2359_000859 [Gordonia amarae]|uniref:Uncharacterized protein n=1 Tax=Gordonia amarae NBRC 15530 TaxID=1075090 RepID=G7GN31_9ACTN|nr:hypothetical protein [Gordonia amarae]GAB05006.1 hypothetical protein GOAMR_25_00430 [Gordonia amarae NBRC 15530]
MVTRRGYLEYRTNRGTNADRDERARTNDEAITTVRKPVVQRAHVDERVTWTAPRP